jgi:hypothetical protein
MLAGFLRGTREVEVAVIRVTKKMMDEAIAIDEAAGDTNMTSEKLEDLMASLEGRPRPND